MKFKDYLEKINAFAEDHPEAMDYDVVYASDDEGNYYNELYNSPFTGHFGDGEFFFGEDLEEVFPVNAVCIN